MTNNVKRKLNSLRSGMTMIELLVAVSVLAILILIFGRVLSQSQRVVSGSQELMKFNAGSTAAANTLKKDIQKISNGTGRFLYIVNDYVSADLNGDGANETWPRARMYMGVIGTFTSWSSTATPPVTSAEAIIGIGLCDQNGITDPAKPKMLWRNCCLLTLDSSAPTTPQESVDMLRYALASFEGNGLTARKRIQLLSPTWLGGLITTYNWSPSASHSPSGLTTPPSTLSNVNTVWKYLMPNVNKLSIMWTKGDITTNNSTLIWYGMDIDGNMHYPIDYPNYPANYTNSSIGKRFNDQIGAYASKDEGSIYTGSTVSNPARFEFLKTFTNPNTYCALWNSELGNDYWPTAIKITYEVTDGKATNPTTKTYEIICQINI